MTDKIISMMPQLLCKQLASDLGKFLDNQPGASPAEMLGQCEQIMQEIGAVKDENGVWRMPEEGVRS
jgi:hypothetical protein